MFLKFHAALASLVLVFSAATSIRPVTESNTALAPAASGFEVRVDRRDGVAGPSDLKDAEVQSATEVMGKLLSDSSQPAPLDIEGALSDLGTVTSSSDPIYTLKWDPDLQEWVLVCVERELYLIDEASDPNPVAVRVERPM